MDRLDTSRWRLGSLFALLACNGDLGGDEGPCRTDDDCIGNEYCYRGRCYEDECDEDGCGYDEYDDYDEDGYDYEYECVTDEDCADGMHCSSGYCYGLDPRFECLQRHGLVPNGGGIPADGAVDLVFADAHVVVAHPTHLDIVATDEVVATVEIGEDIGALVSSDLDADGDADLVVADRGQGGRLIVMMRDVDGAFVQSAEVPSLGVLDVDLSARDMAMPDAIVRTEAGLSRHAALGDASPIVETAVTAFAVDGDLVVYAATGTWWLDLAARDPTPVRIEARSARKYRWVGLGAAPPVVAASFVAPAEVKFWSGPSDVLMERELDAPYLDVSIADVAGDDVWDFVALTSEMFVVAADAENGGPSCTWGTAITETTRPKLELGDIEGDGVVDVAVFDGARLVVWTPERQPSP